MEKPKLTEEDNDTIDEVLDYLLNGSIDDDDDDDDPYAEVDEEFEAMIDRVIRLRYKVHELFKNQ